MATIADFLLNWAGRPDPRASLLASVAGQPQAGSDTSAAQGTGAGTPAPGGPPQAPAESEMYRTPSELFNLYSQLQDRQARAQQINSGIGLMGASLAHPENRAGILATFNNMGGGGGNPADMISGLIDFQSKTAQMQRTAANRAAVPSIASKYGLDPTTALYLFDAGKLDSVIAELEKPDKQIVQGADGKSYIVDKNTAEISDPLGPEKPQELEVVEGPGGSKVVVDKNTKLPIEGRGPLVPPEGNTEFERNYQNAKKENPGLTREQFRTQMNTNITKRFTDAAGVDVGDPPTDMAWALDENGHVMRDERGAPIANAITGTKTDLANKEAIKEAAEAEKVQERQQSAKEQTADIVTTDIDRALGIINENKDDWLPATGYGGLTSSVPLTPAWKVKQIVDTVRANIGFDKLQAMRAASPTGAALGPVSDFENQLLQATLGNLELAQDPEVVRYNLNRIKRIYTGVINGEFVTKDADGRAVPNQEAVNKAYVEVMEDLPVEDLLKMYGGEE